MLTNRKNHYIKVKAPVGGESEESGGVGCLDIWNALPSIPTIMSTLFYILVITGAVYFYIYVYLPISVVINDIKMVIDLIKNEVESIVHVVGGTIGSIPGI
jgi:hypothetical protein